MTPEPKSEPDAPAPVEGGTSGDAAPVADAAPAQDAEPWQEKIARVNDRDLLIVSALIVFMAFVLQVTPARDGVTLFGARLPESCGTKRMGWGECPGCGLTRSFILGVRLDPEAFRLHPTGPLLLLIVAAQIPYRSWRLYRRKKMRETGLVDLRFNKRVILWRYFGLGVLICLLVGWGIRMKWLT